MATTSIIINSTDGSGKTKQKALTNVNPDATNEKIAEFGRMMTATQTGHTHVNTFRIDKIDCDNDVKTTTSITLTTGGAVQDSDLVSAGETGVKVATFVGSGIQLFAPADYSIRVDGSDVYMCKIPNGGLMDKDLDTYLFIPETATQTSCHKRITIKA